VPAKFGLSPPIAFKVEGKLPLMPDRQQVNRASDLRVG
jgi:hypothetical protein